MPRDEKVIATSHDFLDVRFIWMFTSLVTVTVLIYQERKPFSLQSCKVQSVFMLQVSLQFLIYSHCNKLPLVLRLRSFPLSV